MPIIDAGHVNPELDEVLIPIFSAVRSYQEVLGIHTFVRWLFKFDEDDKVLLMVEKSGYQLSHLRNGASNSSLCLGEAS